MRYLVKRDVINKTVTVVDVVIPRQKMMKGYERREGGNYSTTLPEKKFLANFVDGILNCSAIAKFEKNRDVYTIEWLEKTSGSMQMHRDELEIEDGNLRSSIDRILRMYKKIDLSSRNAILKRFSKSSNREDIFNQCWDTLLYYFKNGNFPSMDEEKKTRIYAYMKDNSEDFLNCPVLSNKNKYKFFLKRFMCFYLLAIFIPTAFLFGSSIILSSAAVLLVVNAVYRFFNIFLKEEKKCIQSVLTKCLDELEKDIDYNLLESLTMNNDIDSISLVDFIEKDMDYANDHPEYNFDIESLRHLGESYSIAILDEGKMDTSTKFDYALNLLEIECEMYKCNPRKGEMVRSSEVGFDHLYELFEFIGFSKAIVQSDDIIRQVRSSMRTIIENPYGGCEVEILSMIALAVNYVQLFGIGDSFLEDELVEEKEHFVKKLDEIFDMGCRQILAARKLEEEITRVEQTQEECVEALQVAQVETGGKKIELRPLDL